MDKEHILVIEDEEDLLVAHRAGGGKISIPLATGSVEEVLRTAAQACALQCAAKGIEIELHCEPGLQARLNPPLLEQALVNLIDNAIKYSSGGRVRVEARADAAEVRISVRDWGTGIRSICPASSSAFTGWTRRAVAKRGGPAWGWPSSSTSSRPMPAAWK